MLRFWKTAPLVFVLSALACGSDSLRGLDVEKPPPPEEVPWEDELLVNPTSISFTVNQIGAERVQTVRVLNQVRTPAVTFNNVEVVTSASGFSLSNDPVELPTEFDEMIAFDFQYVAQVEANVAAEIVINNSWGDPLRVPVSVVYSEEPVPCIQVTPTNLLFGTVVRGDSGPVQRTFTIQNCDTLPLDVQRLDRGLIFGIIPTPDEYQWSPNSRALPFTLSQGQSEVVTVTLTPGVAGLIAGSVDVVSNAGSGTVKVNLTATVVPPPVEDLDVHLVLEWDVDGGSDVDFHFYPQGDALFSCADCFFSNSNPDWGVGGDFMDDPFLDYDDLQGPGPENINVDVMPAGSYIIAVHYYSDTGTGGGGSGFSVPANATVQVHIGGVVVGTYNAHLDATNRLWNVARLDWPSRNLTELGDLSTASPSGACVGF